MNWIKGINTEFWYGGVINLVITGQVLRARNVDGNFVDIYIRGSQRIHSREHSSSHSPRARIKRDHATGNNIRVKRQNRSRRPRSIHRFTKRHRHRQLLQRRHIRVIDLSIDWANADLCDNTDDCWCNRIDGVIRARSRSTSVVCQVRVGRSYADDVCRIFDGAGWCQGGCPGNPPITTGQRGNRPVLNRHVGVVERCHCLRERNRQRGRIANLQR